MNPLVYRSAWASVGAWLRVWNRMRIEGRQNVPKKGGVLLVANHASYLDPQVVGCSSWRAVHFLARSSLGKFAPFRWLLSGLGVVFIDREGSARGGISGATDKLNAGRVVCIFPEGTRTRSGHIEPFKRGALLLLKRAPDVAVVPVGIEGTYAALRRGAAFPRPVRVTIRYGEPMSAAEVLAPGGVDELRRRVCALAHDPDDAAGVAPQGSPKKSAVEPVATGSDGERSAARDDRATTGARDGSTQCVSTVPGPGRLPIHEPRILSVPL